MKKPVLDHIGVAVEDLDDTLALCGKRLGFDVSGIEEISAFGVKVAFVPLHEGRIELVEPLSDESALARFLKKKGPGFHHLCFRVDDIRAELARLEKEGVGILDREPRKGAHGTLVAFLNPKSTGGVLIELCQNG